MIKNGGTMLNDRYNVWRNGWKRFGFWLVHVWLLTASASIAQAQTGAVTGRVTDADTGEPLPGVNVVVEELATGAATDVEGRYTISGLRPGTYTLRASFVGYEDQTQAV